MLFFHPLAGIVEVGGDPEIFFVEIGQRLAALVDLLLELGRFLIEDSLFPLAVIGRLGGGSLFFSKNELRKITQNPAFVKRDLCKISLYSAKLLCFSTIIRV